MDVTNVFAAIPVADLAAATAWYERFAGRPPDLVPNEREAAWQLTDSGWIYLIRDAERSGTALVTLLVDDLDGHIASLAARGIEAEAARQINDDGVRKALVTDPEGNVIDLGQV